MSKPVVDTLKHNLRRALSQGHLRDAEEILARLKNEDPLSRETRGFELEFSIQANRLADADALAEQLCVLFPDSSRILYLAGKLSYKMKRYPEAISRLRESNRLFPHWSTQHWLGKALTQAGLFEEAEALLLAAREHAHAVLLDLAWLYQRRKEFDIALKMYEEYLRHDPGNAFALDQVARVKARMLDPETLIEEMDAMQELGEQTSDDLFPEFVQSLFDMGQTLRARDEVTVRLEKLEERAAVRTAWVCYLAQAYDLACALFLRHLPANVANFKYLNALETAAIRSSRIDQLLEAYRALASQTPQLHGRARRMEKRASKGNH